jgi:hypothetical protein
MDFCGGILTELPLRALRLTSAAAARPERYALGMHTYAAQSVVASSTRGHSKLRSHKQY